MKLTSSVFEDGGSIPSKYTCDGKNTNPPLTISDVPVGIKSLTLIVEDPDVPKYIRPDGLWVHWVVFNISPTTTEIKEGQDDFGTGGISTGGTNGYTGPCPPDKEHTYNFYLYALDIELPLATGATKDEVLKAMEGHILTESKRLGRYERNK